MSGEVAKLRYVRCPKCLQVLVEHPSVPVYSCGGCGAVLKGDLSPHHLCAAATGPVIRILTMPQFAAKNGDAVIRGGAQTKQCGASNVSIRISSSEDGKPGEVRGEEQQRAAGDVDEMARSKKLGAPDVGAEGFSSSEGVGAHEDLIEGLARSLTDENSEWDEEDDDLEGCSLGTPSRSLDLAAALGRGNENSGADSHDCLIQELEMSLKLSTAVAPGALHEHSNDCSEEENDAGRTDDKQQIAPPAYEQQDGTSMLPSSATRGDEEVPPLRPPDYQDWRPVRSFTDCRTPGGSRRSCSSSSSLQGDAEYDMPIKFRNADRSEWLKRMNRSPGSFKAGTSSLGPRCTLCSRPPRAAQIARQEVNNLARLASRKHLLRPVSGGAPLVVCLGCASLLQMPTASRRRPRAVRCGCCSMLLKMQTPLRDDESGGEEGDPDCMPASIRRLSGGLAEEEGPGSALHRLMGYTTVSGLLRSPA